MGTKEQLDHCNLQNYGIDAMRTPEFNQKLTSSIMQALGVNSRGVKSFENGNIPKSVYFTPLCHMDIADEEDDKVIDQLSRQGMLVYYVIPFDYEIEGICLSMTSYLCVSKDIVQGTLGDVYDPMTIPECEAIIRDYIKQELQDARIGYAFAYVVNHRGGFGEFGTIGVKSQKGILVSDLVIQGQRSNWCGVTGRERLPRRLSVDTPEVK